MPGSGGVLWRGLFRGFDHVVKNLFKLFQPGLRNNDRIAPAAHVFRNSQKPAAHVFLERKNKGLALDLNLVGFESLFVDRGLGAHSSLISIR